MTRTEEERFRHSFWCWLLEHAAQKLDLHADRTPGHHRQQSAALPVPGVGFDYVLRREDTAGIRLICSGMLPPTLVEYALKHGADGVMVVGCRENDCYFRFGNRWLKARFAGERKPSLRARADRERIRVHGAAEPDLGAVETDLDSFRQHLASLAVLTPAARE